MAKVDTAPKTTPAGVVRLIGGRFRGRRLPVPSQTGLRPTPDRVRETLFNWLAPVVDGSRCLDCFGGSGALGFEAASRGAGHVLVIEQARSAAQQLRINAATIQAEMIRVVEADAIRWLSQQTPSVFDIVFLDPPFGSGLLESALGLLRDRPWSGPGTLIYLECAIGDDFPAMPIGCSLIRDKQAGQVRFGLAAVGPKI